MIYNNESIVSITVEAYYITRKHSSTNYIKIVFDNKSIILSFNNKDFDPSDLSINQKINLLDYIYWDVELKTSEVIYLFDITKEMIELTRLDDNLFKIDINIENPDMIHSYLKEDKSFDNLCLNAEFSFIYED